MVVICGPSGVGCTIESGGLEELLIVFELLMQGDSCQEWYVWEVYVWGGLQIVEAIRVGGMQIDHESFKGLRMTFGRPS